MDFWIVKDTFRADAGKFNLSDHPPASELLNALKGSPLNPMTAKSCFEYLSTRSAQHKFTTSQLEELSSMGFVPTSAGMVAPKDCYIGNPSSSFYGKLFTFVDFDIHANVFLEACKAKKEPTLDDIANKLVADPQNFLRHAGSKAE